MQPVTLFPKEKKKLIAYVLTDIDDTITHNGKIPACAYRALEKLDKACIKVIPITGRPAGWCDHIARMWPVQGVVGENGAFYFAYDEHAKKMIRRYFKTNQQRRQDKQRLAVIEKKILHQVPGCIVSADQPYREADLAIDFSEDVKPLCKTDINRIVDIFETGGATAKISSIHVNGWFGDYNKLSMTKIFFREIFNRNLDQIREDILFSGDSPNDEPMFEYFPNSVGVANVLACKDTMKFKPAWITKEKGGFGFAQLADVLLK